MNANKKDKGKEWLIKLVQDRYTWLSLTLEQAEKIHNYETDIEQIHSDKYIPSLWEDKEIESHFFRQVLTVEQFVVHQNIISQQLKDGEEFLIEEDKDALKDIKYCLKLLHFYRSDLVIKIIQHKKENHIGYPPEIGRRINFLKDEYNQYLTVRLKEVCVSHFRYSRNFQPNKMKAELLRHEIEKTLPSYYFFEKESDKTVREIGKSLFEMMKYEFNIYDDFASRINESVNESTKGIHREFYDDSIPGFAIIELGGERSDAKKKKDDFLSYLLMDSEKYGWQRYDI